MVAIMKDTYNHAKEMGYKYPCYTLFSEERTKPENLFEEETVFGIIRQYSPDNVAVSLFGSLEEAYRCFRAFKGDI